MTDIFADPSLIWISLSFVSFSSHSLLSAHLSCHNTSPVFYILSLSSSHAPLLSLTSFVSFLFLSHHVSLWYLLMVLPPLLSITYSHVSYLLSCASPTLLRLTFFLCFYTSFPVSYLLSCFLPPLLCLTSSPVSYLLSCVLPPLLCLAPFLCLTSFPVPYLLSCVLPPFLCHTSFPVPYLLSCLLPHLLTPILSLTSHPVSYLLSLSLLSSQLSYLWPLLSFTTPFSNLSCLLSLLFLIYACFLFLCFIFACQHRSLLPLLPLSPILN